MRAIILLGPPGAGKGTVAGGLSAKTDYQHISTGDILRAAVKAGSPVGMEAKSYMDKGDLVPDDVVVRLIKDRLDEGGKDDCYMFDGFPRNLRQAQLLEDVIREMAGELVAVFLLEVARETIVERLTGRRVCRECGAVYHVVNIPPRVDGVCDECGGELYQRPDDTAETVENRIDVYWTQTADLIGRYEEQHLLKRVDGGKGKEGVEQDIVDHLKTLGPRQ